MGTRWLERFFEPQKIAVIGASEKTTSMGGAVIQNLKSAGFKGSVYAVNIRRYKTVHGVPCVSKIGRLPKDIDLAIICTPAPTIEKIIKQLGKIGIHAVIILTGGISRKRAEQFRPSKNPLRQLSREYDVRIMGPDCLGLLIPDLKLNASYSHIQALPGKVAYLGQSGTLASALLDWAHGRGIGFSHFLTIGDSADVAMPDAIDYLSSQRQVKAIMLHLEQVHDAKAFVRAVRNASRSKLVLAIKSGRFPQSQSPVDLIPAGLRHRDMVYEAILLRAGVLRVDSTEELFESVESLTRMKPLKGERLAIVANGIGGAILAVDRLVHEGGQLATLSTSTIEKLSEILPPYWSQSNPVDITPEAGPKVYKKVLELVEQDPNVDAILVLFSPNSVVNPVDVANVVINHIKFHQKNLLTSWMGGESVERSRHVFDDAGIPTYDTPDRAIKAFMHMVRHQRNQELLRETPATMLVGPNHDVKQAKEIIHNAMHQQREYLTAEEIYRVLQCYDFKVVETQFLNENFSRPAPKVKFPAALKIIHERYCHPFAYGDNPRDRWRGVVTGIQDLEELNLAAKELRSQIRKRFDHSQVHGFSVQPMRSGEVTIQFSMGVTRDETFGPLIIFGGGGATANIMADRAVSFPPLNDVLAHQLMSRTHIYRVLQERSRHVDRDIAQLSQMLIKLSQMVVDMPNLKGVELNVILHPVEGAKVLGMAANLGRPHELCIRPYPSNLVETITNKVSGESIELRPIRGEDEPALKAFHDELSAESLRYRFFTSRRNFRHRELAQFAQIDYQQEMAFVAMDKDDQMLGVVRTWTDADQIQSEFSVMVSDAAQGLGIGRALMDKMIDYCREQGAVEMMGMVLSDNGPMLRLADKLGFKVLRRLHGDTVEIILPLNNPTQEWQRQRLARLHSQKK
ncbi:GNAT family N-acetyltransferase [Bermanella marisrubri]|uniref:Acyl-CoA synthetase (NDP forming) n=1 Tax=Bermanella marisrubri TaxID=207949 RepID=Q1N4R6_9GAMM|nr:GNAT family N-acetyltransferase [Bermanella marisrubri]EAT13362.1 Acyl-CoA synthetase (NDP forming) [Oceanobacter sp. RED65] [Bermanella marisrubri]QIZ84117.1 GNAT family N-acetyltransferase [Bermanella marisrubri]